MERLLPEISKEKKLNFGLLGCLGPTQSPQGLKSFGFKAVPKPYTLDPNP